MSFLPATSPPPSDDEATNDKPGGNRHDTEPSMPNFRAIFAPLGKPKGEASENEQESRRADDET